MSAHRFARSRTAQRLSEGRMPEAGNAAVGRRGISPCLGCKYSRPALKETLGFLENSFGICAKGDEIANKIFVISLDSYFGRRPPMRATDILVHT